MFLYSNWTRLPLATRQALAAHFGFAKVGPTHVQDNRVVSDGYRIEDVENCLTVETIQTYTGSSSRNYEILWKEMVDKAEGREVAQFVSPETVAAPKEAPAPVTEPAKKRGRPKKVT